MTNILDVFLELSNSNEALEMIFQNYISSSQKTISNTKIAHNKLKTILKQNDKKCLVARYKKISGDTFIILSKQIAAEALKKNINKNNVIEFIKSNESRYLMDIEKFCIGILNFNEKLEDNLDLIIDNHNKKTYIFKGIEGLDVNEELIINQNFEIEMENIKKQMKDIQKRIEILDKENLELKEENNKLLNENKLLKKEVKKNDKEIVKTKNLILKTERENDIKAREKKQLLNELNLKIKEIVDLNKNLKKQNEVLENAIIIDEFIKPEVSKKCICVIHTSELLMVDKIHYDVKFIKYDNVEHGLKNFFKNLKSEGIFKVGLQSNSITSFKIQKIKSLARDEGMQMYRLSFNTEKELCEKLSILK